MARTYPGLADRWHPSASGPLLALHTEPTFSLPTNLSPLGIQMGDSFELVGFVYYQDPELKPSAVVPLSLYWQALRPLPYDYAVSLRLLDQEGQEVFKVDSQHPVLGTYPTSLWSAGEVVADYYEIQIPDDLPPGAYRWGVILYRSLPEGGWENLPVIGTEGDLALGGTLQVQEQ